MPRGKFVLFGSPGGGKTTEAATAFQNSLYIKTAPNILQYYSEWLKTDAGKASGKKMPAREITLETHSFDGKVSFDKDGNVLPVNQKAAIEGLVKQVVTLSLQAMAKGEKPKYDWVIIDEVGVLWNRVFEEIKPTILTRSGAIDTRGAYGALAQWSQMIINFLGQLLIADVGFCLIAHDQEPEPSEQKKGGPKLPSQAIMKALTQDADGVLFRYLVDREIGQPSTRLWRAHASQHWLCKLRGVSDADFEKIMEMGLEDILTYAGYTL